MSASFVPALELNARFYAEVVEPMVGTYAPMAALLGWGSDVLGYDTARSTDHGWGPRLQLFVEPALVDEVRQLIDVGLPDEYAGWPVRYGMDGVSNRHWVEVSAFGDWLTGQLGLDPRPGMSAEDWLSIPQQHLLGVVRGAVYADPDGELAHMRESLAWYPHDVWLWLLASQWQRISQEEAFVGRTAEVGDELGSRLVAGRLVRELMRLSFLQNKAYWPYTKWFGTAFAQLPGAVELTPLFESAVAATTYDDREHALVRAYTVLAHRHNALGLTEPVDPTTRQYFGRPYEVLFADRFAHACKEKLADPWLRELPLVGSVDQFVDSTDVSSASDRPHRLRGIYH